MLEDITLKKMKKHLYISTLQRYNTCDIKREKRGAKEVVDLFYDVLANVWIAIAGVDSRWGNEQVKEH